MTVERMQFIEEEPQSEEVYGDEYESTAHQVYFVERKLPPIDDHPLLVERRELQKRQARVMKILAKAGLDQTVLTVAIMENNRKLRENGVHLSPVENFQYAPQLSESEIMEIHTFVEGTSEEVPSRPHLRIVTD